MTNGNNAGYKAINVDYNNQAEGASAPSAMIFDNLEWLTTAEAAYYLGIGA